MALHRMLVCAAALSATWSAHAQTMLDGPFAAQVVRVVDGDTLHVRVRIWLDQEVVVLARLRGIDAPELRGPCAAAGAAAGAAARDALVGDGAVTLHHVAADKYGGRVDADVTLPDSRDAAQTLVRTGFARPWSGKGKRPGCRLVIPPGR